jgi:pyruvate decarboxylase
MATDILTSELKEPIDLAEYIFRRLHEVGVRSVHGVPGDYNLGRGTLLPLKLETDQVRSCTRLHPENRSLVGW